MKIFNYKIKTWQILLLIFFVVSAVYLAVVEHFSESDDNTIFEEIEKIQETVVKIFPKVDSDPVSLPPPPSMEKMKKKGCVADGFLSGLGGTSSLVKIINRSECYYLHRALETWRQPPDFKQAVKIKKKIKKDDIVYGMFIAEAIDTKDNYEYPAENRDFNFSEMCRSGSKHFWGEHTCKPSFEKTEYRKYLRYITEKAMDMGIQSFLFGQIYMQERNNISSPIIPEIIKEMREYADFKGIKIVIGAQTNDITDLNYLKLFDFIEGGVGIDAAGNIESGPCHTRWWKKEGDWCWGLLWHENFSKNANNVFLHLDWSAKMGDDMSTFSRMDWDTRGRTLKNLYNYFTAKNMGFLMPISAPLPKNNGGCHDRICRDARSKRVHPRHTRLP